MAFLLDANGKVVNLGPQQDLIKGDVIFFNSQKHPSGHIWLTGDNRTGAGDGDDEQIIVKLNSLSEQYQRIIFVVSIYQGAQRGQHFGLVKNAYIRAVDGKGKELCRSSFIALFSKRTPYAVVGFRAKYGRRDFNGLCVVIMRSASEAAFERLFLLPH